MAAPVRIDELPSAGTLSAGAVIAIINKGVTSQTNLGAIQMAVSVTDQVFGATGDGTTDDTSAIQAAIDFAESGTSGPRSIFFPSGIYKVTGTLTMTRGTVLIGEGTTGTTEGYGTFISHAVNNGIGLLWDGNDATSSVGTGGGLWRINVQKATGFTGGDAIQLLATDDSHRPGEMLFDNVLVFGAGTGTWARGLHVDGTACTTAGSKGVRDLHFRKFRVADTTQANQSIYLNQAVHVFGDMEVDTGDGSNAGITIAGDSTDYHLTVRTVSFTINDSTTDEAATGTIRGEVSGAFDNNNEDLTGVAEITGCSGIANAAKDFKIISEKADAFYATVDTTIANVTGDSTNYTVLFETEQFDKNSSYDPATGLFTAKCAGLYHFEWSIALAGITAAETRHDSGLLHRNSGGSTLNSVIQVSNPAANAASGNLTVQGSAILEVSEGDTVRVDTDVSNGTKVVDVTGSSATRYTYFSGKLLS